MVGYPLDTVKVHIQTQDSRNPKYRGTWDCLRTVLAKESVFKKVIGYGGELIKNGAKYQFVFLF